MSAESTLTNKQSASTPALSPEIIAYLDKQLTKPRLRILEALKEHESLHQKELCEVIGTTKNNLSNLLSKLDQIQPKLLNVEISGRTRTYSLTEAAMAYIAAGDPTIQNIRAFTDINGPEHLYRQVIDSLEKFKKMASSNWEVSLNKILQGDLSFEHADRLVSVYEEFINQIISLSLTGQNNTLNRIYYYIDNAILVNGIKDNVNTALGKKHYLLLPLYQLEKQDPKQAQELVNEIINELYPSVSLFTSSNSKQALDKKYYDLFYAIVQMRNEFLEYGTKEEALKHWENPYMPESCIPGYIASIFELISQIPKKSNL